MKFFDGDAEVLDGFKYDPHFCRKEKVTIMLKTGTKCPYCDYIGEEVFYDDPMLFALDTDGLRVATAEDVKEWAYPYCPICGACGEEDCCSHTMCLYGEHYARIIREEEDGEL